MSLKVLLPGHGEFWLVTDADDLATADGPLAPIDHCSEAGEINSLWTALFETSYAHLFSDGSIMRYREQIGTRDDLQLLEGVAAEPSHE